MNDVCAQCPVLENRRYRLRPVAPGDGEDLLAIYSDARVQPFLEPGAPSVPPASPAQVQALIAAWQEECRAHRGTHWALEDRLSARVVGAVALSRREDDGFFADCALLRLDLHGDWERERLIADLLSLLVDAAYDLSACSLLATRAPRGATERIRALRRAGFRPTDEPLRDGEGRLTYGYFCRPRPAADSAPR